MGGGNLRAAKRGVSMGRFYVKSRAQRTGTTVDTVVVDGGRQNDGDAGPVAVVHTYGNTELAHRIAALLNLDRSEPPPAPAPDAEYYAKGKKTGSWLSGQAAYLMRRHDERRTSKAEGPKESVERSTEMCATVVDMPLAERIAWLLNDEDAVAEAERLAR